jgi:hypothetical protein
MLKAWRTLRGSWMAFVLLVALASSIPCAVAQTTINPDISLIGDVRSWLHNDDARPDESEVVNLDLEGVELAIQGYLNPYARADAFIGWHGEHNAEIEEAYFTIAKGLPLGMRLRGGKYLQGFGKINPLHEHAYSFINRPISHVEFFGGHGLNDIGVQGSVALPTGDVATELSVDVLKGDFLTAHEHEHDAEEEEHDHEDDAGEEESVPNKRGLMARLESFFALGEFTSLSVGASGLTGVPREDTRRYTGGIDLKLKWREDRYSSFTAGTEWIVNRSPSHHHEHEDELEESAFVHDEDEHEDENVTSYGGFGYVDYQFRQRYNVGAIGEWTQGIDNNDEKFWRVGGFAGYAPVEETTLLRLLVTYDNDQMADEGFWTATLQMVFSLGPHRPHAF